MKTFQIAVLIAVVVGMVFGLTFLTQYTRAPAERPAVNTDLVPAAAPPLRVPEKVAVWDPANPEYSAEFERGGKGHYDFWVSNPNPKPITLFLLSKSCTCAEVQLGEVPPAVWAAAQKEQAALATAFGLLNVPNLAGVTSLPVLAKKIEWRTLDRERDLPPVPVPVRAADPVAGPQLLLVRLVWHPTQVQSMRLTAEIQHQLDKSFETTTFEVPLVVVPPFLVSTTALNVGEMNYGDERPVTLIVWSSVRPSINIKVEELLNDPCIEVEPPQPLNEAELRELPRVLLSAGLLSQPTRMLGGYAVKVKVFEHRGDKQLELGPLSRKLLVKLIDTGTEQEVGVMISGMVRGVVRVGDANDRDRVDLGTFRARNGHSKTVVLNSTDPGISLQVMSRTPETLQVHLKEDSTSSGQKRWKLEVGAPPNAFSGLMPSDSAIYLQTTNNPPRRIRIPVTGNATH